ncbi:hypothetical protein SPSIL_014970 [Sporomusa silvacetica DSM 10669]|uniref:Uncharacterized protein n=1 Tax=Sporomusa silvacetica DSM 10669 TaxID=1123289 RepID=A0ABZ3II78_9FIRM|nr:hypothetical protein [Sporomusa silvacetica]OZC21559.1 hypothetical protein SPSIL_09700 [Sporomusa silvacetica DSM 10669]
MLKVTGYSDDNIEIDGDIRDEFDRYNSDGDYLAFSDGTVLFAKYDDNGIWRFTVIAKGNLYDSKVDGDVMADTADVINFKDGIKWVVCGKDFTK